MISLNVGCGADVRLSPGWINMDAYYNHPCVIKHDMTKTPWPLPDESVDYVLASHVLEHIPLIWREKNGVSRDIIHDIMEEIHRVMTPSGVFHVKVPLAGSMVDTGSPQHYRRWQPDTFHMFTKAGNYYSPVNFQLDRWKLNRSGVRWPWVFRVGKSQMGLTSHLTARLPFTRRFLTPYGELEAWLLKD